MSDILTGFKRNASFPHEAFVRLAIQTHFNSSGYQRIDVPHSDYACVHPANGVQWVIEAKGETYEIGVDFRSGLGQLVQRATTPNVRYAIALPNIPQFISQCKQVSTWVRVSIGIYWLIVSEDGSVITVPPQDKL